MKQYLEKLIHRENLSVEEMKAAAGNCFIDTVTDSEIAAFLTALSAKGETAEEIAGMVEAVRSQSSFRATTITNAMDNCGTGGDQSYSFNISTTSAFVIAGAGIPVAKHGNRSISSKTGSADVLEYLGISLSFTQQEVEEALKENNIAFLFAPHVHAALKPFTKVRKELGLPTIFNAIGPLTNPVELDSQLLGVYRSDMVGMLAEALKKLDRRRAVVVHGAGGMDEASLAGESQLAILDQGKITHLSLRPEDVGLPAYSNERIRGGDAKANAAILQNVLSGSDGPYTDTVLLNAGLGIFATGAADTITAGIAKARESIASGAANERLQQLINFSKKIPSEV